MYSSCKKGIFCQKFSKSKWEWRAQFFSYNLETWRQRFFFDFQLGSHFNLIPNTCPCMYVGNFLKLQRKRLVHVFCSNFTIIIHILAYLFITGFRLGVFCPYLNNNFKSDGSLSIQSLYVGVSVLCLSIINNKTLETELGPGPGPSPGCHRFRELLIACKFKDGF